MNPIQLQQNRRSFLHQSSFGIGTLALGALLNRNLLAAQETDPGSASPGATAFLPRCKGVIDLCMAGGPSHLETLDYKPRLAELDGQPMPKSMTEGQQISQLQDQRDKLEIMGRQHPFRRCGKSGQEIGDILAHIQRIADDICIVRSMHTDQINHDPAHTLLNTGTSIPGRPSMGSWLLYGLGAECDNLPGYVVLTSVGGGQSQPIASRQWHSGFLPSRFQGVELRSQGEPVLYVKNPAGVDTQRQQDVIAAATQLNKIGYQRDPDPEIETRIAQYELAFRMQASVPGTGRHFSEPQHILDLYGTRDRPARLCGQLSTQRVAWPNVEYVSFSCIIVAGTITVISKKGLSIRRNWLIRRQLDW